MRYYQSPVAHVEESADHPGNSDIPRSQVLDILPNIPPRKRLGRRGHLCRLADIGYDFTVFGYGRLRSGPDILFPGPGSRAIAHARLLFRRHGDGRTWSRNSLQPHFFPKDQTSGLTSTIRLAIAPYSFQMNRSVHSPTLVIVDGVASLVRPLKDPKSLTPALEHLRHARQPFDLAPLL